VEEVYNIHKFLPHYKVSHPKKQQTLFELFFSTFVANNEVLLLAAVQVEFSVTTEAVKLDVELHDIITGL